MTPELLLARVGGQSIALSDPIGGARPEWGLVEAGFGCSGLSECYHLAFRFRYGRDGTVYDRLRRYLRHEAERLAWRDRWKRKIAGIALTLYLDEIVAWVLAEEVMSYPDRQRLLDVLIRAYPAGVYERELADKQRRIAMILDRWNSIAHESIARRIRDNEDDDSYAELDTGVVVD